MDIRIATEEKGWDEWFIARRGREFLQSWAWGEFQRSVGHEPVRLQAIENGAVVEQMQGFLHRLLLGLLYVYLPKIQDTRNKIQTIIQYLKKKNVVFARLEPAAPLSNIQYPISNIQARQPRTTLLLDLTKSEETLLKDMHPKTRYNIGLAERKGVEIREGKNAKWFWSLNVETTARDAFKSHPKVYYEKMLGLPIAHQLTAFYQDEPVASHIYIAWGGRCTYLHGASANTHREVMAPYLLQWRGIQMAKKYGNSEYDFWGVASDTYHVSRITYHEMRNTGQGTKDQMCFNGYCWEKNHPWSGVTRYKVGFGGEVKEYPEAVDVVLRPGAYWVYRNARTLLGK